MAEGEGGGSAGVVAVVAIFIIVLLVIIFFAGPRYIWGGRGGTDINVNVQTPGGNR